MSLIVRTRAEFDGDFPDDHIWADEERGITLQTGGKAIAETIADILKTLGCEILELEDLVEHCWECHFLHDKRRLYFSAVDYGDCEVHFGRPMKSRAYYRQYADLLVQVDEAMRRDGRFRDLKWVDDDGRRRAGGEGFERPVETSPSGGGGGFGGLWTRVLQLLGRRASATG